MTKNSTLIAALILLLFSTSGCGNKKKNKPAEAHIEMDKVRSEEVKIAAGQELRSWLSAGISGVQFLQTSQWKIGDRVFLNSHNDRGYLLLLNQDKDPLAEVDYVQVLYAVKDAGKWNIYLESLPNLIIPRKKENGRFVANNLVQLAAAGEKEMDKTYKNGNGKVNDELVNREFNDDLRKNHERFLSKKIKN
ncbi:hypothetical protein [Pedobacter caeni]|uniref:Lipoprotein n=1 Tax=Pedobacter caeni TaxID=288992 RepID=A0A1M4ZV44_9SPHI|nr:hypothetical protein [Pedobacter caeni]SHF21933.1 hypothetical protein SAMN04488522_102479 [Pedobacter caeni]